MDVTQKNELTYVCKVLVRNLSKTMNPGKLAAQVHHAGVQMVAKNFNRKEIKDYINSVDSFSSKIADGFGITIVLEYIPEYGSENAIRTAVEQAKNLGYISGIVVDPSYPVEDGILVEALTCGYILAPVEDMMWNYVVPNFAWKLHR